MPEKKERWSVGRTRHVRVYLTEEEHAVLRMAAAAADLPLSQFSVQAIVEAARKLVPVPPPPPRPRKQGG
jgi:uncharacterized protein (DUF1778 family)